MSTRIMEASIAQYATTDLADGKFARFSVDSDTGAVENTKIAAARLYISAFRSYSSAYALAVKFDASDGETLATTGTMESNDTVHAETLTLSSLQAALISSTPDNIYLVVEATSGAGNKINFREACTITLEIDYVTKCTAPTDVTLSRNTSEGENVTLSWKAGAGGANNAASYYQIARRQSSNGTTWGKIETYASNVGNVTSYSVPPPETPGTYYLYSVRLVGEAGLSYASEYAKCSEGLYNPPIAQCTAPSGVSVSAITSKFENVTLSWQAGAGGAHNAASYYQIARRESTDGKTWGAIEFYAKNVGNVTSYSVPPPDKYGRYFMYFVRLMGDAGGEYASEWVQSANTLYHARPALVSYTDSTITAGKTRIKAAHITEMQTNVNRLRQGLGLPACSFASIRAGYTSLAGWSAHVAELRAAIDEMGITHEAWAAIQANSPTAAVMQQLRRVVAAI